VHDLVHCERRSGAVGVLGVVGGEGLGDLRQPVIQLSAVRARVIRKALAEAAELPGRRGERSGRGRSRLRLRGECEGRDARGARGRACDALRHHEFRVTVFWREANMSGARTCKRKTRAFESREWK
jgi:hypothetical protein